MDTNNFFKISKEVYLWLIEGSLRAVPFNILVASLLAVDLVVQNNALPSFMITVWWLCVIFISLARWFFSKHLINTKEVNDILTRNVALFFLFTFLTGVIWGSCYLIFLPILSELQEFIIILVFGGLCAGAIASLSVYMPAYYAYILPMFIPVIIYNYYLMSIDRIILATTFLLFIIMLIITAHLNRKLVYQTFTLSIQREKLINKLEILSVTDPLTGLYNRRQFDIVFHEELNRARRNQYPLNFVSIDIDNFKLINDFFGHPYGDEFLIFTAEVLKKYFQRTNDFVVRFGGDEFGVIVANMPLEDLISLCTKIKEEFKSANLLHAASSPKEHKILEKVTLSMGIAYIPCNGLSDMESTIIAVDKALYQAKKQGKNKIITVKLV